MAKNLVIVESPTKTKTLKKILGRDYNVLATKGHIMDLPKSRLGVDLENKFEPEYEIVPKRKETINELKKAAKEADKIYLAPDPDREGEAIAYHVAQQLKLKKPLRASFNEITKEAVKRGIVEAGKIDIHKVEAQQARRILDRLVGYQISPLLWKTVHRGLSAGRVQSVALRLVCERDEEIEKFVPKEYWSVKAFFETPKKEIFAAKLAKIKGENFELGSKAATDAVLADIEKQKYAVSDQRIEERQKNPYPPYITSTLQQDASRRLGFSTSKTMTLAQRLYEGAEIGGETVGLITYMRTDSVRVAKEAQDAASQFIQKQYGKQYLPEEPRAYKSKKGAQDAHEAIRPTYFDYPPSSVKKYLEKDLFRLYELIWNRFVASQMASAIFDALTVEVSGGDYLFRASSQNLKFPGFLAVYDELKDENGDDEEEFEIPMLKVGTPLGLNKLEPAQHFTKPPARFTEAALVRELEARGIGRPSTYASIITTIKTRHYVEVKERRLHPTDLGKTVNRILVAEFPDIFDYEFTREMEEELDSVEDGKDDWVKVLKDFYEPFEEDLAAAKKKEKEIRKSTQEKSDEVCEKMRTADGGALGAARQVFGLLRLSGVQIDQAPGGLGRGAGGHRSLRQMRVSNGYQARTLRNFSGLLGLSGVQKHQSTGQIDRCQMPREMRWGVGGAPQQKPADFLFLLQVSEVQVCHLGPAGADRLSKGGFRFYADEGNQGKRGIPSLPGL